MPFYRHGESNSVNGRPTRLWKCWECMRTRARGRESCLVYDEWRDYLTFKAWSLANGYTDKLVLCRNGDTGNYEPNNVRWDTVANNIKEANSKHYIFEYEGKRVEVYNLAEFCRENNLAKTHMSSVHAEKKSHYQHKGWSKWKKQN